MVDKLIIDWIHESRYSTKVCVIGWDDEGYVGGILDKMKATDWEIRQKTMKIGSIGWHQRLL